MLTQKYLSVLVIFLRGGIELEYCNYYHLLGHLSSKFQSPITIFYHKLLTREDRVLGNGWTHPSSMIMLFSLIHKKWHPKSYHSDIKHHMTLNMTYHFNWICPRTSDMLLSNICYGNRHNRSTGTSYTPHHEGASLLLEVYVDYY